MPISKEVLELMSEASLALGATVPTAAGGTECAIVDLMDVSQCALQLEAEFNADATGDAIFHIRASMEGGTTTAEWDTVDYDVATLSCVAGHRAQITIPIDPSPSYITGFVVNADGVYTLTNVKITRAIQQIESL